MAEAVKGINRIILMRPISLQDTEEAGRLAFQTQHEKTSSRESNSVATKDGNIASLSEETVAYSLTSIMATEDVTREKLEEAYHKGELIEFWDINKTAPLSDGSANDGKYPATYVQGYLTEWNETATSDGNVEITLATTMNGSGVKGYATLSNDQAEVVQYAFADTTVQTTP